MSHIVSKKRNIRTIKALRGEALTIDLGKAQTGTLKAWMKKDPNDTTYRSFDIQDNRYLILSKDKTQDYYHTEAGELLEAIEGRWYFDVRRTPESGIEADDEVIYTGVILFENQITNSSGVELVSPALIRGWSSVEDIQSIITNSEITLDSEGLFGSINLTEKLGVLYWGQLTVSTDGDKTLGIISSKYRPHNKIYFTVNADDGTSTYMTLGIDGTLFLKDAKVGRIYTISTVTYPLKS